MHKSPLSIVLSASEQTDLLVAARSHTRSFALVQRARIILLLAQGVNLRQVSLHLGIQRRIVRKWGQRFEKERLGGLQDAPRPGRAARFSPASRFETLEHLERQLRLFMEQWNQTAKPFAWTKGSFDKVLSKVERSLPAVQIPRAA